MVGSKPTSWSSGSVLVQTVFLEALCWPDKVLPLHGRMGPSLGVYPTNQLSSTAVESVSCSLELSSVLTYPGSSVPNGATLMDQFWNSEQKRVRTFLKLDRWPT